MSEEEKKFLEIVDLKKGFGSGETRQEVLRGMNFSVAKGEFCVLLGPSGSGKSTLLNIIGGIDSADSGYISINGDKLEQWCAVLKTSFPMRKESIETLFRDFFNVDIPAFTRESYTYEQYLEEVVASCEDLEIVDVYKEQSIYVINLAIVEFADGW